MVVSTHLKTYESKWKSSPNRGESKKIFETTNQLSIFSEWDTIPINNVHLVPHNTHTHTIKWSTLFIRPTAPGSHYTPQGPSSLGSQLCAQEWCWYPGSDQASQTLLAMQPTQKTQTKINAVPWYAWNPKKYIYIYMIRWWLNQPIWKRFFKLGRFPR